MPVSFLNMAKKKGFFGRIFKKVRIPILAGDTPAKFFFIALSVLLWFLIKLNKEGYTGEINLPVKYENIPSDKRLLNDPPRQIKVQLRSQGYDILKYKLRSLSPLVVDVSRLVRTGNGKSYWATSRSKNDIANTFGEKARVVSIDPDTVFFHFSTLKSKKFKVYLKVKRKFPLFKTFYRPPLIRPDSIIISGSAEDVNDIDSVFTETVELTAEEDTVTKVLKLRLPKKKKNLQMSADKVQVRFTYTSLTEGSFDIPVKVINLPDQYKITVFPDKVKVKFQVPLEDYQKVDAADFEAYVDFNQIKDKQQERLLTVKLRSSPAFLRKVSIDPRQLEYILINQ